MSNLIAYAEGDIASLIAERVQYFNREAYQHKLRELLSKYHPGKTDYVPQHIGVTSLIRPCARRAWYDYRWASDVRPLQRHWLLFQRGHLEEYRIVAALAASHLSVVFQDAARLRFYAANRAVSGVADALLVEAPQTWHVLEMKTANAASFRALQKQQGDAWAAYYKQIQMYLYGMGCDRGVLIVVNKNDDSWGLRDVERDQTVIDELLDVKVAMILDSERLPPRIAESPDYYQCKMCPHAQVCWLDKPLNKRCRNCRSATNEGERWHCRMHDKDLSTEEQWAACPDFSPAHGNVPPTAPF